MRKAKGESVAVIGAGPAGLVAARFLKAHGFRTTIYEATARLGGQWNVGSERSAIWPGMRANTSRAMTRFSDLDYPAETDAFPSSTAVLTYLQTYATRFELPACLRPDTEVETIARHPAGGWAVHSRCAGLAPRTDVFDRVLIASGRYAKPLQPDIAGLKRFRGSVTHSCEFRGGKTFSGQSVVVAGGSASAVEVAASLAASGVRVTLAMRRAAAVVAMTLEGEPADTIAFNRYDIWARETLFQESVASTWGSGVVPCDRLADHLAASRIVLKPWIDEVDGNDVRFSDGTQIEADAIVLATGYAPDLAFLDRRTRASLACEADGDHAELHAGTLHPELPGLAFIGLGAMSGPTFAALEAQARWVAYGWAGLAKLPSAGEMGAAMRDAHRDDLYGSIPGPFAALRFARLAGVEPDASRWPDLARALIFGPITPISFRLSGPDALPDAAAGLMSESPRFSKVATEVAIQSERRKVEALVASGRGDLAWMLPVEPEQLADVALPTRRPSAARKAA